MFLLIIERAVEDIVATNADEPVDAASEPPADGKADSSFRSSFSEPQPAVRTSAETVSRAESVGTIRVSTAGT